MRLALTFRKREGNGPYNVFMHRYHNYLVELRQYLPPLHVITTNPERRPDRPHWYEAEDKARAAGVPMRVLRDDGRYTEGKVLYEGSDLEGPELWNSIVPS